MAKAAVREKLFKAIKSHTLKVTQHNAEVVKKAYIDCSIFNEGLKRAALENLPDPDGISSYPQVFEDWLVKAYRRNFKSTDEVRAALHSVRDKILAELFEAGG
jgi:hypothetical protein